MIVIGDVGDITDVADNTVSYAEKLSAYDFATETGRYYEIADISKFGLFAWVGIIGIRVGIDGSDKARNKNINIPSAASSDSELIVLIANMIGG